MQLVRFSTPTAFSETVPAYQQGTHLRDTELDYNDAIYRGYFTIVYSLGDGT
ncbi:MAG: hypothetical protein ACOH1Y_15335 [Propionicimonas sp.]